MDELALPEPTSMAHTHGDIVPIAQKLLVLPQVGCPVEHFFGGGICIRQVTMPSGTFSIGHYQKKEHMNVMLKGRVTMLLSDGTTKEIIAPATFTCQPGRKIGYIHEEMVWQNIYPTNETDVEKVELEFIDKGNEFLDFVANKKQIEILERLGDVDDYKLVLEEFGYQEEDVRKIVENVDDMIVLPNGNYKFKQGESTIDGIGLFATANITKGEVIAPARISSKRTLAGRYTNHAKDPNAKMVLLDNNDVDMVAIKDIKGCYGGFDGEEITIDYRVPLSFKNE